MFSPESTHALQLLQWGLCYLAELQAISKMTNVEKHLSVVFKSPDSGVKLPDYEVSLYCLLAFSRVQFLHL